MPNIIPGVTVPLVLPNGLPSPAWFLYLSQLGQTVPVASGTTPAPVSNLNLTQLGALTGAGIPARSAGDAWALRTITGTTNKITVSDGDGASGNPTLTISATYVGQTSITTLGTITTGVWTGTAIAVANGGTGATTAPNALTNLGAAPIAATPFSSYFDLTEMTAPAAPAANQVRIYAQDNGAGKTQLMALFSTGAAQQIAIQP